MERRITQELRAWKSRANKKPLLISGARQVGKTTSVRQFAAEAYENYVELNFEKNERHRRIFDGDLDAEEILTQLAFMFPGTRLKPHKTLLFFDEIQDCPRARSALKFLALDGRFDVIASGSLLGTRYKEVPSFPVGYVDHLDMHSLDFDEFLAARGISPDQRMRLEEHYRDRQAVPGAMHDSLMRLFREYTVVGGMPAAVREFVDSSSYARVLDVQRGIVQDYLDDIAKYARDAEKAKARACFLSIPSQLARDYKKFSYSVVESKSGARKYGGSLQWLYDANIIEFCHNIGRIELPLEGSKKLDEFKVYMRDTGLLVAMLEDGSQRDILNGNLGIYKGALFENAVADAFAKAGRPLYYFRPHDGLEIDFIIRYRGMACAVEVKSADNRRAKSMRSVLENHHAQSGIKLSSNNVGESGPVLTLPLYMAHLVARDVDSDVPAPLDVSALEW